MGSWRGCAQTQTHIKTVSRTLLKRPHACRIKPPAARRPGPRHRGSSFPPGPLVAHHPEVRRFDQVAQIGKEILAALTGQATEVLCIHPEPLHPRIARYAGPVLPCHLTGRSHKELLPWLRTNLNHHREVRIARACCHWLASLLLSGLPPIRSLPSLPAKAP